MKFRTSINPRLKVGDLCRAHSDTWEFTGRVKIVKILYDNEDIYTTKVLSENTYPRTMPNCWPLGYVGFNLQKHELKKIK